ncbi:TPA: hypothetical protein ACH3X2_009182 [Trebouxia sp. C0005]
MAQSYAEFGDLDIQQSGGQEEAEFGALELQQAQILFSALNTLRQGQPPLAWESEAAAEIEDIKERTSQAATATDDPIARRAVLLMTKRDLADLCLEGLLEATEQQQQVQLAALLQALREYQSDTFDDWRDLLEEQERRTRDELDASKAALARAEKTNAELSDSLADERADRVLYLLKSQIIQIELEQSEAYIKQIQEQANQDQLRNDNTKLSSKVQQHLLTIQQLTEQVQALTSLKRSRSTADQQEESGNDSSATDIDVDTFPGLEVQGKASDGAVDSMAAISKSPLAVGAVGFGDEESLMLSQKSLRWRRVLSPRKASLPHEDWVLRGLTLHQLKDIITDIYASKVKADARSADQNQPRETMEQHLLAYLTNKYGVRQLITQWLTSILAAVEHFSPLDAQTALFGKVLRNEVEEEFEETQLRVKTTASSLLQSILQARHPLMPDDSMAELLRRHLKGTLPEELWKEVVQGFCKPKDVTTVWARVQAAGVVHDSAAGRALSPSRARSPSPVKDGSLAAEKLRNINAADPAAVSFHVVVEVSLSLVIQLAEYQAAFVPVAKCKMSSSGKSLSLLQLLFLLCCSVHLSSLKVS